ncbi:MAG: hypothetical protein K6F33_04970 [Bacteroidales bacterium]|nr:hypothetical protein [Bacteroidales bacterium]
MKKIQIAKVAIGLSAMLIAGNVSAQSASDVVMATFPQLAGELAISESTTYNPALKTKYRDVYSNMDKGIEEIVTVEHIGVNEMPELQFFDAKTLKDMQKAGTLPELKQAIRAEQQKIATLMREEKYGADSATCIRLMSTFAEYAKQNAWEEAYPSWSILFKNFPKCSQTVYSNGVNIVKKKMQKATTGKEQQIWVDTLMMVYDQRIKYFAASSKNYGEAYLLGRKGVDLAKYRKEPMEAPYNCLMKSIDLGGKDSEYAVIQTAMQSTITMYNAKKIDATVVVDKYLLLSDILAQKKAEEKKKLENAKDDKAKKKAESDLATCAQVEGGVLSLFSSSDAAQCEVLVNAFTGKLNENPNDIELCDKIVKVLGSKGCNDTQLYEDAVSKVIASNPTESACFGFAKMLEKKGKEDEAIENYKQAISLAETDTMKAIYNCSIAKLLQKKNQFANARSYARQAIELNPNYGLPYIIIATMYGSNPVGEDSFEKSMTYWLVIDKLQKAKSVDPSIASEAQTLINRYIGSCPKKEEAFMHSVTQGKTVTIGGWIGETTTARF